MPQPHHRHRDSTCITRHGCPLSGVRLRGASLVGREDVIFFVMHTPALPEREEASMRGTWLIEGTEVQSPTNAKEACTLWSAWARLGSLWLEREVFFFFYSHSSHITLVYYCCTSRGHTTFHIFMQLSQRVRKAKRVCRFCPSKED